MQTFHFHLNARDPNSDLHLISPNNITPESRNEGYEKRGKDPQLKKLLIVEQILSVSTFNRKCMENSVENTHTNVRGNNHQLTQLLIVKQILLVSTLENV